jgi:hypothetical protein
MIGVTQDDLGIEIAQQIPLQNALNRGLRAHRHKHRRLDLAMSGVQNPGPRAGLGADCLKLEAEHSASYCISRYSSSLKIRLSISISLAIISL